MFEIGMAAFARVFQTNRVLPACAIAYEETPGRDKPAHCFYRKLS